MSMKKHVLMLAGAFALASATAAFAAGMLTNGLPVAGGTQYPSTIPLTGLETIPADTNLTGGLNPASEAITTKQLSQYALQVFPVGQYAAATNTAAFTATTAQMVGAQTTVLDLTGTLTAGAAITTPTAAAIIAALPGGGYVGETYALKLINNSSGAFSWTLTAGSGVTVSGTATVAQNTSRTWLVTEATATTVTMQNIGAGTN